MVKLFFSYAGIVFNTVVNFMTNGVEYVKCEQDGCLYSIKHGSIRTLMGDVRG